MKLYNDYIKIKNRSARRQQWIGDSPIYVARIEFFKAQAYECLRNGNFIDDVQRMMLQTIVDDIVTFPVTKIHFKRGKL